MDELTKEVCEKHGTDPELVRELIDYEQGKVHMERRRGAKDDLRRFIEQYIDEKSQ